MKKLFAKWFGKKNLKVSKDKEVLRKGDYVIGLTKEQFEAITATNEICQSKFDENDLDTPRYYKHGLMFRGLSIFHARKDICTNQLEPEQFLQRAKNTFGDGK